MTIELMYTNIAVAKSAVQSPANTYLPQAKSSASPSGAYNKPVSKVLRINGEQRTSENAGFKLRDHLEIGPLAWVCLVYFGVI